MKYILSLCFSILFLISNAQTFTAGGGSIPDASDWTNFPLNVINVGTVDCDIIVCLTITHTWTSDLDIRLISPNGTIVELSSDNGGSGNNYTSTCFDMQASTFITNGNAPFNGSYIPEGNLSNFNNQNANGTWNLSIRDDTFIDTGNLISWSIEFNNCDNDSEDCNEGLEEYTLTLFDSFGDGWIADWGNGSHTVEINGQSFGSEFNNGYQYVYTFCASSCLDITFYDGGLWQNECSFEIENSDGNVIFSGNDDTNTASIGTACGCTDPLACNFDEDAIDDNGSCVYTPLEIDQCETLFCGSETGEQVANQYGETSINYLTIEITQDGILNELFYDVNWHSHGWGNMFTGVNNARITIHNQFGTLIDNPVLIGNTVATTSYQNFSSIIQPNINVFSGYTVRVYINSPSWGNGTWASYVNQAIISFTVETELANAGSDATIDLCYDDTSINLFDYLGSVVDTDGTWSPALEGGYLGTFDPQVSSSGSYTYSVQSDCNTDEAIVDINITNLQTSQINCNIDTVCQGSSSVTYSVTENPNSIYSWAVNNGTIIGQSTGNSITVDFSSLAAGNYSNEITLTENLNGCSISSFLDVPIFSNPVPNLTLSESEICLGESIEVSANASYSSYEWTPSITTSNSANYSPQSTTDNQISVSVTGDGGCSSTEVINFTIYDLPLVNLASDNTTLCLGDSMLLSSIDGYDSYTWTPSIISGFSDVYIPTSTTENLITLTVSGDGGCMTTESLAITVNELPIVNLISDQTSICIGESISLSTTGGYSDYSWSPSSISSNSDTYTPNTLLDNQFNVTVTSNSGCIASDSTEIIIYDLPIVNLTSDVTSLCLGDSIELNSNSAYNDYSWSMSSLNENTLNYSPLSSSETSISLTITAEGGCSTTESIGITVYDLPIVNLTVDNNEICIGESINLNTTSGYFNYDWVPDVINSNTDTYQPNTLLDNQFKVTITGDGGCTSTDSISIVINSLPVVEVSLSDSTICLGDNIEVNATSGYMNYNWSPSEINTSSLITPLLSQTNFSVDVMDENGCESSDDAVLIINESSPINLSVNNQNTTTICIGEEIDLEATDDFESYTWFVPLSTTNSLNYTPTTLSDNQFSVIGTNEFGCISIASSTITINDIPSPSQIVSSFDETGDNTVSINLCQGSNNILFNSNPSSDINQVEWVFLEGNGAIINSGENTSELNASFPIVEDYVLEFREYGSPNCYTSQEIDINVNPNPNIQFTYVENCYLDSIYFINQSIVDTTIQYIFWEIDGQYFETYDLVYSLSDENKMVDLSIVDVLNCSSKLSTNFIPSERPEVEFYHTPEKVSLLNPEVSFINLTNTGDSILWKFGNNNFSGDWNPTHVYDSAGWYEVVLIVQNEKGCQDSIAKQILVENDIIYYIPNTFTPDEDGINDTFGFSGFNKDRYQSYLLEIYNNWGECIFVSNDTNIEWDGKLKSGKDAMIGNYNWSIKLTDELGKEVRSLGSIMLMR
ncbi:MAG: gliding motility-associated C-terminal domain-containing protein [Flavobacteriales bacterium]